MKSNDVRLVAKILGSRDNDFPDRLIFTRYIQADPHLSATSRVEIEETIEALSREGLIEITSSPEPFRFRSQQLSAQPEKLRMDGPMLSVAPAMSTATLDEVRRALRAVREGDQIYYSTYAGTSVLDEFGKEFEHSLRLSGVKLHVMMLGSLSDPVLKEAEKEDDFRRLVSNAEWWWSNLENLAGRGKVEVRQAQGLAGLNRGLAILDAEGRIKFYGSLVWQLGNRAVDGLFAWSTSPNLSISRLLVNDLLERWQTATNYNGQVFVCHSHKDKSFCRKLVRRLLADGVPVWFDENDIVPGDDFVVQMEQGLQRCDYTAVVITPNFLNGPWAQREFRIALEKEASSGRVHVIPVYRATVDPNSFPPFLRTKHYADFRVGFDPGYSSLMRALRELPLRRRHLPRPNEKQ